MSPDPDYPVTRLQAIKWLKQGGRLEKTFHGGVHPVQVMIRVDGKRIICRFWSRGTLWINIAPKQLLGFIRRNYVRSYLDAVPIG